MKTLRNSILSIIAALAVVVGFATPASAATYTDKGWATTSITVCDNTNGLYPVAQAVANWNQGTPLNLVYKTNCSYGITVAEGTLQDPSWSGQADWTRDGNGYITSGTILFTNMWDLAHAGKSYPNMPLELVTHEIGHTLGLAHAPSTVKSVMQPVAGGDYRTLVYSPTRYDKRDIRYLYGSL